MSYSTDSETKIADKCKDDMASRRISSHIPAPLRKKKNDDNYKRFITPIGNPMAALQKHMRSKSLSDLNAEKKEEENHRAEINTRYGEMEKLKAMLKEDEDSWKSKLQGWKNRRRSVTEDVRKRKEERDTLEREAEEKASRRRTKTYNQIVEEKRRRDRELANLNDRDEYEFVSPRSSEADMPVKIITKESPRYESESSGEDEPFPSPPQSIQPTRSMSAISYSQPRSSKNEDLSNENKVQYKYTTKVTAQIGVPPSKAPQAQPQRAEVTVPMTTPPPQEKFQSTRKNYETANSKPEVTSQNSNVPKVLLRSKGQSRMKERPKSAHELMQGSSTLPRSYQYIPTPKPFIAGEIEFKRYRKTAFANRRNMWESMGSNATPQQDQDPIHRKQSSEDLLLSQPIEEPKQSVTVTKPLQNRPLQGRIVTPQNFVKQQNDQQPLITRTAVQQKPLQAITLQKPLVYPTANTAKLSSSGLTLASPRLSKSNPPPPLQTPGSNQPASLFDDMKICINQRPRSEKGFGFTVRGGDDGKPVIVDSVSAGGAADICHLCVSDEILAINDVPLADCKTQDDIVQLIVSSVITGHLSLNIRRYGKPKKTSSLGLSGTKVVMTPGGFVSVRSDKTGSALSSPKTYRKSNSTQSFKDDNNNNGSVNGIEDFPPPPSREELDITNPRSNYSPRNGIRLNTSPRNNRYGALAEVYSNPSIDDDSESDSLAREVQDAQKALDFEQVHMNQNQYEKNQLRKKLMEEQKRLEQEEVQREVERKKIQEETRLEDERVARELRKIQDRTQKQMEERRALQQQQQQQRAQNPFPRPSGANRGMGGMHWLVEEAERRRVAESSGRLRMNALSQSKQMNAGASSVIPPHVIQHLTHRSTKAMGQSS